MTTADSEEKRYRLAIVGASLQDWATHLWIDCVPRDAPIQLVDLYSDHVSAVLHLQPVTATAGDERLLRWLFQIPCILDCSVERVALLQSLSLKAFLLDTEPVQDCRWLTADPDLPSIQKQFGLPDPIGLSSIGIKHICLGISTGSACLMSPPSVACVPVFPVSLDECETARLYASWLRQCLQAGLDLWLLHQVASSELLYTLQGIRLFSKDQAPHEILEEIEATSVASLLALRREEFALSASSEIWSYDTGILPDVTVVVSSFNYGRLIGRALDSCCTSSRLSVELVVVDDASDDDSVLVCADWMKAHASRFARMLLLRHDVNSGLSAARNTAFSVSRSEWCFVLDADNAIRPTALEDCLALTSSAPPSLAVVHPLIAVHEADGSMGGVLGSGVAWSESAFVNGNCIDAMALVRCSAWRSVGGYSHIPFGWEDFDFWCKLHAAGFHGLLCPRVLADYYKHDGSMVLRTNRHQEFVKRLIRARHPWLQC